MARSASQVHIRIIQVSSLVVESGHTQHQLRQLPVSMRAWASFQLILRIIMYLTALTTHSPIVCHAHSPLPIIPPLFPALLPPPCFSLRQHCQSYFMQYKRELCTGYENVNGGKSKKMSMSCVRETRTSRKRAEDVLCVCVGVQRRGGGGDVSLGSFIYYFC